MIRQSTILFVLILCASPLLTALDEAERHATFGFAFNFRYEEPVMLLRVCGVLPDSAASDSGLREDDEILAIDGRSDFSDSLSVLKYLFSKIPGETVEFTVRREGEEKRVLLIGREATDEQVEWMERSFELAEREAERRKP